MQRDWRFCSKCFGMYFNGGHSDGVCPTGGGHQAQGFNFVLPHDVNETAQAQGAWRFCSKCSGMFWNGAPSDGVCPTGSGHHAQGFNFVLPHEGATRQGGRSESTKRLPQ